MWRYSGWRGRALNALTDFAAPVILSGVALHELLYNLPAWPVWALVVVVIWPLVLRRRFPVVVFAVSLAGVLGLCLLGVGSLADTALLVALYSVAAHRRFRVALSCAVILEAGVVLVAYKFAPVGSIDDAVVLLTGTAAAMLFLGTTLRTRRGYLASVEDRAERLERERAQQAELAALAERARIAREMHDIVAHGLSVVITLSEGAAATAETDPAKAKAAMQQVAAGGRQSLAEMRRLFDVLRAGGPPERAPQPVLAGLPDLIRDVEKTGLVVSLTERGDPAALGDAAQATVYRIVQEALTNVIKHAPSATSADVELDYSPTAVAFAVQDDGGAHVAAPAPGNGLTGMRERVAIFDGTLTAGPVDDGWRVAGELVLA